MPYFAGIHGFEGAFRTNGRRIAGVSSWLYLAAVNCTPPGLRPLSETADLIRDLLPERMAGRYRLPPAIRKWAVPNPTEDAQLQPDL